MASQRHIKIIGGTEVQFNVYVERRRSVRVAFGKTGINVRLPSSLTEASRQKHFASAVSWVEKQAQKNPASIDRYQLEDYGQKDAITIYGKEIKISVVESTRQTGSSKYIPSINTILLSIPEDLSPSENNKFIKSLLSRTTASMFGPKIEARVREINEQHFHKEIKSVKLKYNRSNWGSCSSAKNINLSTRLLFAPMDVIDYVIVHELAHLYEMNHSPRFWDIVRQVMPTYKEKEAWLTKNGHLCDF